MAKRKLVTVADNAILTEIGGIAGPIVRPTRIGIDAIKLMVRNNRNVFEHNPANVSEKVKLTLANLAATNFAAAPANAVKTDVAPAVTPALGNEVPEQKDETPAPVATPVEDVAPVEPAEVVTSDDTANAETKTSEAVVDGTVNATVTPAVAPALGNEVPEQKDETPVEDVAPVEPAETAVDGGVNETNEAPVGEGEPAPENAAQTNNKSHQKKGKNKK